MAQDQNMETDGVPATMRKDPQSSKTHKGTVHEQLPLTEDCHHYSRISEVPWDIQKYWHQRHSIFSNYDEGIYMTDDAWFGVTPEPVARQIAADIATTADASKTIVIDIFAGAGGNAIAFALSCRWERVIAIERDASVLACAQHNADIYGAASRIEWVHADCFSFISANQSYFPNTVIFASPPWGGPGYRTDEIFDLSTMQPYSVNQIHEACKKTESALYLPRTSDLRQIAKLAPEGKKVDVVQYCMEGASKALVAYIPAAASP